MAPSASAYVYWLSYDSGNSRVGRADIDGGNPNHALVSGIYYGSGVATDGTHVFWGESGSNPTMAHIGRAGVDGSNPEHAYMSGATFCGIFNVRATATDLYWLKSNCSGRDISHAPSDGSQGATTIADAGGFGCGMAIDSTYVYWSNDRYIGRALLSGAAPNPTWLDIGAGVSACAVAVDAGHIYWTVTSTGGSASGSTIGRATIDGNPLSVDNSFISGASFFKQVAVPSGIAVDNSFVYWTNQPVGGGVDGAIGRANIDGTGVNQSLVTGVFYPVGLDVDRGGAPSGTSYGLSVTRGGNGSGTVTSQPAGISCGAACSAAYASGTSITLTAAPDSGSTFSGWSGDCSGTGTCTVSMTQARAVTATFAAGQGPPGTPTAVGCVANKLILTDVFPRSGKTQLIGVAPAGSAGKRVTIVSTWNGKTVAKPTVRPDLTFSAAAPLPASRLRLSDRTRYLAKLGSQRSRALKFARRMYTAAITNAGRTITFTGNITRPLAKPIQQVVVRASSSCSTIGTGTIVATVKPSPSGAFTARFDLPPGQSVVFLRAQTKVRKSTTNKKTFATFTLVRGVKVAP
jgi:hypothetical protein